MLLRLNNLFCTVSTDGFNRVQTEWQHQAPAYIKKWALLHKKSLDFFIVAPGHRWHVEKKKIEDQQHARLLLVYLTVT